MDPGVAVAERPEGGGDGRVERRGVGPPEVEEDDEQDGDPAEPVQAGELLRGRRGGPDEVGRGVGDGHGRESPSGWHRDGPEPGSAPLVPYYKKGAPASRPAGLVSPGAPRPVGQGVDVPPQVERQPGPEPEPRLPGRAVAPGRGDLGDPPAPGVGLRGDLQRVFEPAGALDGRLQQDGSAGRRGRRWSRRASAGPRASAARRRPSSTGTS